MNFADDAIRDIEEAEFYDGEITKSKIELETEELILSLRDDRKISKAFELGLRLRPLGLRLKKVDNELSFRMGVESIFFEDSDFSLYEYYQNKRHQDRLLLKDYSKVKRNNQNNKETELDILRKQKIKLMRKNK